MRWRIGKSIHRKDVVEKVTGAAKYTADESVTPMYHVKLVVSFCAHANLKRIDTSQAYTVPGVRTTLLGQPLPLTWNEVKD